MESRFVDYCQSPAENKTVIDIRVHIAVIFIKNDDKNPEP